MFKRLDFKDLEHKVLIILLRNIYPATSWLKEKEDIFFNGMACFSLNQLKLLSVALELILSLLSHSDASLTNILPIDYFKCMPMCITKG